ncbi:MAG: superoxide dismutase family protein [Eubacteriales bacterium]|nr:superoxide dismutase family protein [Eubacteriales bacterium]MDD4389579.1 superoxide dismutase family protein [Eubacteriales bacterium]
MENAKIFFELLYLKSPQAIAQIYGSKEYPLLRGLAKFYSTFGEGIIISIEVMGLPNSDGATCGFYSMHIHEYGDCSENFNNAGGVLFLEGSRHPYNAGALPPLMSCDGYAWMTFYDDRIGIADIIGRSIVIHDMHCYLQAPELRNNDERIACGIITTLN